MEPKLHHYSQTPNHITESIRENSPLGKLEKKICKTLHLTEPHQHLLSPLKLIALHQ